MNFRNTALAEIISISHECPDYTAGQILLAIIKRKPEQVNLNEWLRDISNEDMYTLIEETKIKERL